MLIRLRFIGLSDLLIGTVLVALAIGAGARLEAQDAASKAENPGGAQEKPDRDAAKRMEQYKRAAGRYTIERHSDPPVTLTLLAEPALRWNSPLRTAYDGVLFLWVADGRPEVAATFYRNIRNGVPYEQHEFQSLATTSLTASYAGKVAWTSREPGVALATIPGAPKPASTHAARLRQMRALALEFRAETNDRNGRAPLRLLTQPLYRYETSRADLADGALFGFVHASDPEVLLLIEARPADGVLAWHYGFARMSGYHLRAWHKDQLVWDVQSQNSSYSNIPAPEQPR